MNVLGETYKKCAINSSLIYYDLRKSLENMVII